MSSPEILETPQVSFGCSPEERFTTRLESRLDEVEAVVQDVFEYAQLRAQQLLDTLGQDQDYFLSVIFDRGACLYSTLRRSTGGSSESLKDTNQEDVPRPELQKEFDQEFESLMSENQRILSEFLEQNDHQPSLAVRSDPADRAADAEILLETVKGLILLLKCRCGVDGFFCITRNSEAYELRPEWFFSDPDINTHLSCVWDINHISYHPERFSLSMSPDRYATWMRAQIKNKIDMLFSQAIGRKNSTMDYENYEKAVLIDRGVALAGWTHPIFACPSALPLEVRPLEELLCAVQMGKCHFRRITEAERAHHLRRYMQRMRDLPLTQG